MNDNNSDRNTEVTVRRNRKLVRYRCVKFRSVGGRGRVKEMRGESRDQYTSVESCAL